MITADDIIQGLQALGLHREVLATADRLIRANPAALLCEQPDCRCYAALQQRLETIAQNGE